MRIPRQTTRTALALWFGVTCAGVLSPAAATAQPYAAPPDWRPPEASAPDPWALDEARPDETPADAGPLGTAPRDGDPSDVTPSDVAPSERGPRDAASSDPAPRDWAPRDWALPEAGPFDEARPDEAMSEVAPASETVDRLAARVMATGDAGGLPFIIIDKVAAEVFVYDAEGRLQGAAPALIGLARGDLSAPGIGDRPLSAIRPNERTTPAGRFVSRIGPAKGAYYRVPWVDFATAISMHPVVTSNPKEHRLERLRSLFPDDRRITYGCINVSFAFYDRVVRPTFTGTDGVVYILPEILPLEAVFPALGRQLRASAGPAASDAVVTAGSDAAALAK